MDFKAWVLFRDGYRCRRSRAETRHGHLRGRSHPTRTYRQDERRDREIRQREKRRKRRANRNTADIPQASSQARSTIKNQTALRDAYTATSKSVQYDFCKNYNATKESTRQVIQVRIFLEADVDCCQHGRDDPNRIVIELKLVPILPKTSSEKKSNNPAKNANHAL